MLRFLFLVHIYLVACIGAIAFADISKETSFFPPPYPAATALEVIDMTDAGPDRILTATTFQGLVNRQQQAKLYLLLAGGDAFWLQYLETEKFIEGHTKVTFDEALKKYASVIQTLVVYDLALPASINIATMIAAREDGVAASPEAANRLALPGAKRIDLRGRWKRNAEAYRWAVKELMPVMNKTILACYHPTACSHHIRDYLVQHKVFHFWASSSKFDALPHTNASEERAIVEEILATTPATIPVLGFWYSGEDPGLDEYAGVGLAGQYGKITVVCDWATNLSVLGGINTGLDAAVKGYRERLTVKPPELDRDKVYLCMDIVESGDSPGYVQSRMHKVWQDDSRGGLPINWSLGPALFDLAPPLARYFYTQATPADYLYMSISGAGYCHPYRGLFSKTPHPDTAWRDYLDVTQGYLKRMHTETLGLYTDAWKPFDRDRQDAVTARFTAGLSGVKALVLGMGRDEGTPPEKANYRLDDNSPLISHIMTRWPTDYAAKTREENIDWLVEDIRAHTPGRRPAFLHVMALSWVFGPSELTLVLERLGPGYVPLTIPQFTRLYGAQLLP